MKPFDLGIATISYDSDGKAMQADFLPTGKIHLDPKLLATIAFSKKHDQEKDVKDHASLVLGAWFAKSNEVELADRDRYQIDTEVIKCEKYANGNIKMCAIKFIFKDLVV